VVGGAMIHRMGTKTLRCRVVGVCFEAGVFLVDRVCHLVIWSLMV
jgi:hypothetical protein